MLRQQKKKGAVVVVVEVIVVVVIAVVSAATTMLHGIKGGGSFSSVVLSFHEGVIKLQLEGGSFLLSLQSGTISSRRIMTRIIPLRRKMTHGSFCRVESFLCITPARVGHSRFPEPKCW